MSDNEAFLSALKLRPNFFLLDFLTFSVLPRESYFLHTVVFGIFNKHATCYYEWPPLILSAHLTNLLVLIFRGILLSAVYLCFWYRDVDNKLLTSYMTFSGVV